MTYVLAVGIAILLVLAIWSLATILDKQREREALNGIQKTLKPENREEV